MYPNFKMEYEISDNTKRGIDSILCKYNFSYNYGNMRNTKIDCSKIIENVFNQKSNKETSSINKNYEGIYMIYDLKGSSKNNPYQELLKFL